MSTTLTAEPGTPLRPLRADAARNRQALIEAAQRLFAVRGLCVTLDDIAAEAGVNVATAYRHFSNKHELAEAFLAQVVDDAIAIVETAAGADDPWTGLVEFFDGTFRLMQANRGLRDVFTHSVAEDWMTRLDDKVEPILTDLIARCQRAGQVRADLVPADIGVLFQMLAALDEIPAADDSAMGKRYLQLLLDGLRPAPTALPGTPPSKAEVRTATIERHMVGKSTRR